MSKGGYRCVTETAFQASLSAFLKSLGLNVETLLRGVDFSQLSPAVNLISTVPGLCYAAGLVCHVLCTCFHVFQ